MLQSEAKSEYSMNKSGKFRKQAMRSQSQKSLSHLFDVLGEEENDPEEEHDKIKENIKGNSLFCFTP